MEHSTRSIHDIHHIECSIHVDNIIQHGKSRNRIHVNSKFFLAKPICCNLHTYLLFTKVFGDYRPLRIQVCLKKGISSTILFWRWDEDLESYWSGFLGDKHPDLWLDVAVHPLGVLTIQCSSLIWSIPRNHGRCLSIVDSWYDLSTMWPLRLVMWQSSWQRKKQSFRKAVEILTVKTPQRKLLSDHLTTTQEPQKTSENMRFSEKCSRKDGAVICWSARILFLPTNNWFCRDRFCPPRLWNSKASKGMSQMSYLTVLNLMNKWPSLKLAACAWKLTVGRLVGKAYFPVLC